jgi:hypothetical protein
MDLNLPDSGWDLRVGCREYGNEPLGCINDEEFIGQLSDWQFLNRESDPYS